MYIHENMHVNIFSTILSFGGRWVLINLSLHTAKTPKTSPTIEVQLGSHIWGHNWVVRNIKQYKKTHKIVRMSRHSTGWKAQSLWWDWHHIHVGNAIPKDINFQIFSLILYTFLQSLIQLWNSGPWKLSREINVKNWPRTISWMKRDFTLTSEGGSQLFLGTFFICILAQGRAKELDSTISVGYLYHLFCSCMHWEFVGVGKGEGTIWGS